MRFLIFILPFLLPLALIASADPFMVETKIQTDLETSLSRLIPREQFLVQASSEIETMSERKVVEGETILSDSEPEAPFAPAMPGFTPESEPTKTTRPMQTRQVYRTVQTPVLRLVRVRIDFDDKLPAETINRARTLGLDYLRTHFPNKSTLSFSFMPMLKPPKSKEESVEKKPVPEPAKIELSREDQLWNYSRWALLTLVLISILLQFKKNPILFAQAPIAAGPSPGAESMGQSFRERFRRRSRTVNKAEKKAVATPQVSSARNRLLEKFIAQSESFRGYYAVITDEERSELYAGLKGPGYNKLLEGMGLPLPLQMGNEPHDLDERLERHEKSFAEFSQAKDWRDRQFFGFLQTLSQEQLIALVNHEEPATVCMMLRFLKPQQSAFILDTLPAENRREVLGNVTHVQSMSFADMVNVEKEVRTSAMRIPSHIYGSQKDDMEFWGSVINESTNADSLLSDLEKTNPGISSDVAKFKFKLEDAASLPDNLLNKVLSDVDNEEFSAALASVRPEIASVFLDAVSPQRRKVLEPQIMTYRRAPQAQLSSARSNLTRRIRERLA
jgi:hypothetical protein